MPRAVALVPLLLLACERSPAPSPPPEGSARPAPAAPTSAASSASAAPLTPQAARFLDDLNAFCVASREVKADSSIPRERQAAEIIGRLVASKPGPEFLRFLRALDAPSGELRYQALKRAAAERGAVHWSCPALAE